MSADFSKIISCVRLSSFVCVFSFFCGAFVFAQNIDLQNEDAAESRDVINEEEIDEEKEDVELTYRTSSKKFRLFNFGQEVFSVGNSYDGKSTFVTSDGSRVLRHFYDSALRKTKTETWSMAGGIGSAAVVEMEEFVYKGDSIFPALSTVTSDTTFSETSYDENGKPTLTRLFKIVEVSTENEKSSEDKNKDNDKEKETEKILDSISSWKYSDEGKITELSYKKMDDDGEKVLYSYGEIFSYHEKSDEDEEDIPPDYEYYEDEKLRTKTVYSGADSYETSYFFDGGYVVTETYEAGNKISESVQQNSAPPVRRREYVR